MRVETLSRLCWSGSCTLTLLGGAAIWYAFARPLDLPPQGKQTTAEVVPVASEVSREEPELEALLAACRVPLRRPIFDPPPPLPPAPPPKIVRPPPPVKLLGTVLGSGEPMAMIADASGAVEFKKVGDGIGAKDSQAVIAAIEASRVEVAHEGRTIELRIEGKEKR